MPNLNETPRSNRLHIGFFGRMNSGKSSLLNAFCGQQAAIVSAVPGTTTDPVYRAMEINGLGPCVLIDTAGFDDSAQEGNLGESRIKKTTDAAFKTDIAVILYPADAFAAAIKNNIPADEVFSREYEWQDNFEARKLPVLPVLSKTDLVSPEEKQLILAELAKKGIKLPIKTGKNEFAAPEKLMAEMKDRLALLLPESFAPKSLTEGLCNPGDSVMLIMPQDPQAPMGRLILPQAQTIRDLLDRHCIITACSTEEMPAALERLKNPPDLIITDSQAFAKVWPHKPPHSRLTSFSILFAAQKGDIAYFTESAKKIAQLKETDKVLIAESCTHAPMAEDIGRVKIPRMLRKKAGEGLKIEICAGTDFPLDLTHYSLVIHCGGCMFSRRHILSRVERAKEQGVPMTNYGVALAALTGILDKVSVPEGI